VPASTSATGSPLNLTSSTTRTGVVVGTKSGRASAAPMPETPARSLAVNARTPLGTRTSHSRAAATGLLTNVPYRHSVSAIASAA
jgi:hypothetical protein